ncbi:FMRFamide receptor [Strongyloides ratti]|uniref:FMRFamide receptor n=1 Tax=Strongyloides ratti TaxID=34506 RepID=A0A090LSS4_STRRB|nr:FMRFamide receptor [Strongyloides ratti]CEF71237.1 FMRFamide receptor [Strongyloides ratti]
MINNNLSNISSKECFCNIITEDLTFQQKILILGLLPTISFIGIIDNIFNFIIYIRNKNSGSRYLAFLSISDFGICLMGILVMFADSLRTYNYTIDQMFSRCMPYLQPLSSMFQMFSVYITVGAAINCYYSVSPRHKNIKNWYSTVKFANKIATYIFVFIVLYNIILFKELETVLCFSNIYGHEIYELCPTDLRISETYMTIYRGYMYAILCAVSPFLILCILTIGILSNYKNKNNSKIEEFKDNMCMNNIEINESNINQNHQDEESPIVLILVVILFLICNIIPLAVNICEFIPGLLNEEQLHFLSDIGNNLVVFNATANFFIYAIFSNSYRQDLLNYSTKLFCFFTNTRLLQTSEAVIV